ncbi:uncharacterized protein K452DRAFT_294001 [Aplosporella prunicola CBS 121167]|uniref:Uncharacterized protein n=1 Tax=Aplosporella prunicola CBS 121167 TaxID=1176127 RepID=A0A6A6BRK7_9PEZI|nr:uncharacterized protein K452DRAFT_294001 [Aplosporella prunicola CBS 121167]KAF2146418.1 hypothetical protein K452DRAFT_294001 [Aplosporella prunicola CBS 121167]
MERPRLHSALPDAQYEDLAALENNRQLNDLRLKGTFEHIFQKYSRDFSNVGDEIDLRTGEIVVNNGHVAGMMDECDTGEDIWRESDSESENEAREQPTEPSNPGLAAMDGPAATNGPRTSINKKRTAFLKLVELNPSYADRDYKTCTLQNMKKELDELQPGWDAEILVAMAGATESVKRAKVTKETKPGRALEISNQPLERDQPLPVELGQPLEFEPDQQPSEGTNFQFLEIPDSQASQVTMSDGPLEGIIEAAAGMSPAAGFVQSSTTTIDPFNLESGIRGDMSADAKDALGARRKSRKESSTRTPKLLQKSPSEHTPQQPVRLDPVTHKKHRVEVAISQMRNQETEESTDGSAEHARNQAAAKEALQTPNTLQSIDSTASSKGRPNGKHPFVVKTPSTKRSGKATESIVENLVNGSSGKPVVKAVADTPVNASAAKSPATPGVRTPINASSAKSIAKKPFATPANASPRKKSNGELPSAKPSAKPSANSMTEAPAQNTEGTAAKNRKASATEAEASPTAKTPKSTAVHRLQASGPKNPSTPQVESSTDKRDPGTVRGPKSGSRLSILDMMDCSEDELAF